MTIQKAIESAIEGGFMPDVMNWDTVSHRELYIKSFMLNPKFWQALGKTMEWKEWPGLDKDAEWYTEWHRMIDMLVDSKTIEQSFETL